MLYVTCDLIPLAVLKRPWTPTKANPFIWVTCDLIPLAVLKLAVAGYSHNHREVTCDLIPLAVLKLEQSLEKKDDAEKSHVISYRLRY